MKTNEPVASLLPSISDVKADAANQAAIDRLVRTDRFHHIVAWGKWLGFTPLAVLESVRQAEADDAPADSIQKLDGKWVTLDDIANQDNRQRVEEIAAGRSTGLPQR